MWHIEEKACLNKRKEKEWEQTTRSKDKQVDWIDYKDKLFVSYWKTENIEMPPSSNPKSSFTKQKLYFPGNL